MAQISLTGRTLESLQRVAARKGTGIGDLLNSIIEKYVADERLRQIDREQQAFEAQHNQLRKRYRGQYIAMSQGRVIDHDMDEAALWKRVHNLFGDEPVLISPVLETARQTILIRSPHLLEKTE
jgi:hypothetical protein